MHHQTDAGLRCLSAHVRQTCTQAQTHMCACVYTGWKRNQNVQLSLLCKIQYPQNAGSHIHMITLRGLGLSKSPAWGCVCGGGGTTLDTHNQHSMHGSNSMCVCASMCLQTQKCVCTHSRGSTVTQQGHYLSPDWDEGNSIGFALRCGSHKDQETTFPPHFPHEYQRRGSASATATATHKEKLQPYYFICITCNRHHIGRCIYCLISSSLAVNICWFISHRAIPKHRT